MAGNSQMNNEERCIFSLNGISGMLIATVLLLSILTILTYFGIQTQSNEAQNYYKIDQDLNALKSNSPSNSSKYELVGKK